MANLNSTERTKLNELINEMGTEDNTEYIRTEKNSVQMRDDIRLINKMRSSHADMLQTNLPEFIELCQTRCPFLFNNYTNIFNKVVNGEIDLGIMTKFLVVLKLIEDGKVDQHEGSVMIGKILKELYLDSAVKKADKLDKLHGEDSDDGKPVVEAKKISWNEYKQKGQPANI